MFSGKNLIYNSLSVTFGLILYSLIVYLVYYLFLKETQDNSEEQSVENSVEHKKENIDNFDILEDA